MQATTLISLGSTQDSVTDETDNEANPPRVDELEQIEKTARKRLAKVLSDEGKRRAKFYVGALSGAPMTLLTTKEKVSKVPDQLFFSRFFGQRYGDKLCGLPPRDTRIYSRGAPRRM